MDHLNLLPRNRTEQIVEGMSFAEELTVARVVYYDGIAKKIILQFIKNI